MAECSHPPCAKVPALSALHRVLRVLAEVGHVVHRVGQHLPWLQVPLHSAPAEHLVLQLLKFPFQVFVTKPEKRYNKIEIFNCSA